MSTTWSNQRCDLLHDASCWSKGKCGCGMRSDELREKNVNYDSAGVVVEVVVSQQALESTPKMIKNDC